MLSHSSVAALAKLIASKIETPKLHCSSLPYQFDHIK